MSYRLRVISVALLWVVLGVAACSPSPNNDTLPTISPALDGAQRPKRLATVFVSPTPNEAEQQATRLAQPPTENPFATPLPTLTPTVYVGLFLGDSGRTVPRVNDTSLLAQGAPTVTVVQTRCALAADEATLGVRWQTSTDVVRGLGCPIEGYVPFGGTTQVFENGVIYLNNAEPTWAILAGEPGRFWYVEQAPAIEQAELEPPLGYRVPSGNIGAMWQGVAGVRDGLGWALTVEIPAEMGYQRFEGGSLFYDGGTGQVFALLIDGRAYGPY